MQDETKPSGTLVIQVLAMPKDTNANGDIFGGWLVSHMDMGAGIAARFEARCRVATVAIDSLVFLRPVAIGDVVACYASMIRIGRTSMRIHMEVWTASPADEVPKKSAEGIFTFVALDMSGRPQPVKRSTRIEDDQ